RPAGRQRERPPDRIEDLRLWIQTKRMVERRGDVLWPHGMVRRISSVCIAGTVHGAPADATAGHHHGVALGPMPASFAVTVADLRAATKLAHPQHECFSQQPALA